MNIVTEGMIARPNMSLRGGKEGGFRRKKRRKEARVQKNDRNKVTVSGKSVEGGNEGKVCTMMLKEGEMKKRERTWCGSGVREMKA